MELDRRSPGLDKLVRESTPLEQVAGGLGFTEGPVWMGDRLVFADIRNNQILEWASGSGVRVWREPSNYADGLTVDAQRRVIACEGATRRLTRYEDDGSSTVLAERFEGQRINSPNDVICSGRGDIYFSDPFWFGGPNSFLSRYADDHTFDSEPEELGFQGVFLVRARGELTPVARDFERPNGLALSPDERTLYVDDTRRRHIRAFDVQADGALTNDRIFAELIGEEPGVPDGMKVDSLGNVYCTGPGGIWVINPSGEILGRIRVPEVPANLGWGGPDWRTLFITARTGLYRTEVLVPGLPVPAGG
jgi:gluconolactonase